MLESYACKHKELSRFYKEDESKNRTPFQRDRDRIIHSLSFRRLEYKTQVFVNFESDHFRTRLTHSLEVAQISRAIARRLGLDQDLAEAIALAHDIGHPPFGHAGEDALNKVMKKYDGFDHNAQGLKILIKLESPYAEFEGLNLTYEVLEGILKHNGPLTGKIPKIIHDYDKQYKFHLKKHSCLEAQIASLADDIAYNNHDIDDGFRANLIFELDFKEIPLVNDAIEFINKKYPNINQVKRLHEVRRIIYSKMVDDLIDQTLKNLESNKIKTCEDIRNHKKFIASFSPQMQKQISLLSSLLYNKVYNSTHVRYTHVKSQRIVTDIFNYYIEYPECLNDSLKERFYKTSNKKDQVRVICDYIAGMTDRFAYKHHKELIQLEAGHG